MDIKAKSGSQNLKESWESGIRKVQGDKKKGREEKKWTGLRQR